LDRLNRLHFVKLYFTSDLNETIKMVVPTHTIASLGTKLFDI
jgi:hypothetical protein